MDDPWRRPSWSNEEHRAFALGYALGLIAGEGSFTHGGWDRNPALQVRLHARDPQPLKDLRLLFGGRIYGPYCIRGKRFSDWRLSGKSLAAAISLLLQHLPRSHKRGQFLAWAVKFGFIPEERAAAEGVVPED